MSASPKLNSSTAITALGTAAGIASLGMVMGGGIPPVRDLAIVGLAAGAADYGFTSLYQSNVVDTDRYLRAATIAAAAGGASYFVRSPSVSSAAMDAGVALGAHVAGQYYAWGGLYL